MNFPSLQRRLCIIALFIVGIAVESRAADAFPTIFLTANQTVSKNSGQSLLIRELVRQAILLTAREEFGLVTRDAALREFDPSAPNADITDIRLEVDINSRIKIELFRAGSKVWSGEIPVSNDMHVPVALTDTCEKWSRKQFVEALKAAGFGPVERPKPVEDAKLDEPIPARMAEMNFVSQFQALRLLHEQIRTKGQSAKALGALVRTYANLGILAERQWYAADRVFKARALLYAQKMHRDYPASAEAMWHRAYANALTGLYGAAREDIKWADNEKFNASRPEPPVWLKEIDAFCHYDVTALEDIAGKEPAEAQLATFLAVLNVAASIHSDEVIERGRTALLANPENYCVIDHMSSQAGVSFNHLLTVLGPATLLETTLLSTLPRCIKLPAQVTEKIDLVRKNGEGATADQIADIWKSLDKAGQNKETDRGEPSLAALGRMIEDLHFLHTWRRARFLRDSLGSDAASVRQFLQATLPLVSATHPFKPFAESFGISTTEDPARCDELLCSVKATDLTMPTRIWQNYLAHGVKGKALWQAENARLYYANAFSSRDSEEMIISSGDPAWQKNEAGFLLQLSPHSPFAIGTLVATDWAQHRKDAAAYEKLAPGVAYLKGELAKKYIEDDRIDDAVRCFKAYLEIVKDPWVYIALADLHLKQGDEKGWLATLETYLKEGEDFALWHAQIRVKIARGLMSRGKYHQAAPYADAAASTGAAWALLAAAECHESLGETDRADEFYREGASYPSEIFALWFSRWRNNSASLPEVEKQAMQFIDNTKIINPDTLAAFYLIKGDRDAALKVYRSVERGSKPLKLIMHIALAADEAGDTELRNIAMERASSQPKTARKVNPICTLDNLFRKVTGTPGKELDLDAADKIIQSADPAARTTLNEATGRFLFLHGDKQKAQDYLKAAIQSSILSETEYNLAWAALKNAKQDPRKLRDVVKDR